MSVREATIIYLKGMQEHSLSHLISYDIHQFHSQNIVYSDQADRQLQHLPHSSPRTSLQIAPVRKFKISLGFCNQEEVHVFLQARNLSLLDSNDSTPAGVATSVT